MIFTVDKACTGSKARAATLQTLHGEVQTPVFMPVGTQATVKAQTVESLKTTGSRVLLANTYHLLLRPGPEVFEKVGGIHRFMNWDGPVLTDSGGFQIFSLPHERTMNEDGAVFKSYVDGKRHLLSPESSIAMQRAIGSDIMMALDQCIPSTADHAEAEAAMALTHRWAARSLEARGNSPQSLFGIVQGACHLDLREKSAEFLGTLPFDGLAIGGLAVGETVTERYEMTGHVTDFLSERIPRYLMGVGTPIDLLESVYRGVDMFDCIIPSQLAQRGVVFTSQGKLQLRRSVHKFSEEAVDAACPCAACRDYSRAYLHHLIKTDEVLGWHLLTIHNFTFYHRLMWEMREAILVGKFPAYYERQRVALVRTDEANPSQPGKQKRFRKNRPARLGNYEVQTSPEGFSSIRQISSGEVMHSVSRPSDEANRLYVDQSCFGTRLLVERYGAQELVIWDVGLGAGFNAMALLERFEAEWGRRKADIRPVRLVSFERDLNSLRLAAKDPDRFPHLRHAGPHELLKKGSWVHGSGLFRWNLIEGDFQKTCEDGASPDVIFYDPFSYKTDSWFWTVAAFAQVFRRCAVKPAELYTYSASTAVRAALLYAGFFVAEGAGIGLKTSTTAAFTTERGAEEHPLSPPLLAQEWLVRWRRSHSQFPADLSVEEQPLFEKGIEAHRQFNRRAGKGSGDKGEIR